ncbi:hypothetical protein FIE12Z_1481 [Fusarium flagelliforme]|uniref:Uncharacterized protein n=1 Tax=Fusarium flagelliforme TaxID=2675880 RepID=A0A395N2Z2_9HYPO|nr:hypothetical protein FIE12Z_1481 [Fusarium flagelliforme]
MRGLTLWPILIIAISLCDLIHAENYRLQDVPRCAINCLDKSLEEPTFSDANISRLCSVTAISNEVLACVRGDCSVKDLLGKDGHGQDASKANDASRSEYMRTECKACNRPDIDNDHNIRAINFFILGAILVSVGIRIWTKLCRFTKWGTDDYLIIPAAVNINSCTNNMHEPYRSSVTWVGLGHDIWTISEETTTRFFIYLLVVEFTYVLSLCLIKLSILFFFLRIFPDPTFIKIIRWTIGFTILTTTVILILACLQSAPTEPSQEGWDGAPESGPRLNIQALILSHAGINVALDVWMFILPLTQLYNLGLKARKKIGIMLMFSVGIFLIAVSCIRIPSMRDFNKTLNATSTSTRRQSADTMVEYFAEYLQ